MPKEDPPPAPAKIEGKEVSPEAREVISRIYRLEDAKESGNLMRIQETKESGSLEHSSLRKILGGIVTENFCCPLYGIGL